MRSGERQRRATYAPRLTTTEKKKPGRLSGAGLPSVKNWISARHELSNSRRRRSPRPQERPIAVIYRHVQLLIRPRGINARPALPVAGATSNFDQWLAWRLRKALPSPPGLRLPSVTESILLPPETRGEHHANSLFSRRPMTYVHRAPALFALHVPHEIGERIWYLATGNTSARGKQA